MRKQRCKEEEEEAFEEEGGGGIAARLNNLNIETAGMENETAEGLEDALGRASQNVEVEEDRGS